MLSYINERQLDAFINLNICYNEMCKYRLLKYNNEDIIKLNKEDQLHVVRYNTYVRCNYMLIINYLYALLVKGRSNESSIYKNKELYEKNKDSIDKFIEDNKDIINKIKELRDKYFAHIDEEINDLFKSIFNDDLKVCINFLNKLFNIEMSIITNHVEKYNISDSIAVVKGLLNK